MDAKSSVASVFEEWKKKRNSGIILQSVNEKENKLSLGIYGKQITLIYPPPNDHEAIFFIEQKPDVAWVNDFNDYALSECLNWNQFASVLDKIERYSAPKVQPKTTSVLKDSTDGLKSSRDDSDEEHESQEMDLPFRVNFQELAALLTNSVKEAEALVGLGCAKFYDDSGTVSVRVDVENVLSDQLALAMDLTNQEPIVVTLDFQKRSFKDFNSAPGFSISQRTKKDSFGVKFHLKQIVQTYIQENWKGEESLFVSSKPLPPSTTQTPAPSNPPSSTPKEAPSVDKNKLAQLLDFGFSEDLCIAALEMTNNNLEVALDKLVNNAVHVKKPKPSSISPNNNASAHDLHTSDFMDKVTMLVDMGFDQELAYDALSQAEGNFDHAMEALVTGAPPKKSQKNGGNSQRNPTTFTQPQSTMALQSSNFFVKMIAYIRTRLHNYTNYCIICQKKHACNSNKPVVCCTAMCQFRYQDLRFGQVVDGCQVCAFADCRGVDELQANEEVVAALVACKDTGLPDEILLDMFQHKYLPNEHLLKFIEEGVKQSNVRVAKIENILKPELVARYELKWEKMKRELGDQVVKPEMVYHGTPADRLPSILEKGLLVPGKNNNVTHATDTGYWGKGIYLSPNPSMSIGYCRGGNKLLICSVLMGRKYQCTNMINGQPKVNGYDSHVAPGGQEWIVFEEDQVLPCYVVDIDFNNGRKQ